MINQLESILLQAGAVLLVGAILVGIADTPLYPIAFGIEIVALIYVLVGPDQGASGIAKPLSDSLLHFIAKPTEVKST